MVSGATLRTWQQACRAATELRKPFGALVADQRFKRAALRHNGADVAAIAGLGRGPDVVGLGKQPAGVERDQIDIETLAEDGVADRLILNPEAGGEGEPAGDGLARGFDAAEQVERSGSLRQPVSDFCRRFGVCRAGRGEGD